MQSVKEISLYAIWTTFYKKTTKKLTEKKVNYNRGEIFQRLENFNTLVFAYEENSGGEAHQKLFEELNYMLGYFKSICLKESILQPLRRFQTLYLTAISTHQDIFTFNNYSYGFFVQCEKGQVEISPNQVCAGSDHTLIIDEKGKLFGFGSDEYGQLGLGGVELSVSLQKIPMPSKVKFSQISAAYSHSLALSEEGEVYVFGKNEHGQLGLGHKNEVVTPTLVEIAPCQQISAGNEHSLLLIDNTVYVFGKNDHGQLGLGHTNEVAIPTKLSMPFDVQIRQVVAAADYSLILCEGNLLFAFGNNDRGQLGLGHTKQQLFPTMVPTIPGAIRQIACGLYHNLILYEGGRLYSFGGNAFGQLGSGHINGVLSPQLIAKFSEAKPCQIVVRANQSFVKCEDNSVYSFGANCFGELGHEENKAEESENSEGLKFQFKANHLTPKRISALSDGDIAVKEIIPGVARTLVLSPENQLYGFGYNQYSRLLGSDFPEYQLIPRKMTLLVDKLQKVYGVFPKDEQISHPEENNEKTNPGDSQDSNKRDSCLVM